MASLKELRKKNNLTQQELSNISGLSIRTIQRLEKGLTAGSPHTLKTLAKTLNVEDYTILVFEENEIKKDDYELSKVKLLNFCILSVFIIPFGNIILPALVLFRYRKNKTVNHLGRRILSFQIINTFILFFLSVIVFLLIGRGGGSIPLPVFVSYVLIIVVNITIVVITSFEIDKNKDVPKFFPSIL